MKLLNYIMKKNQINSDENYYKNEYTALVNKFLIQMKNIIKKKKEKMIFLK